MKGGRGRLTVTWNGLTFAFKSKNLFQNMLGGLRLRNLLPLDKRIRESILNERGNITEPFPSDFSEAEKGNIEAVRPFTMTSFERLVSLSRSVDHVVENKIAGDIVECGVWRGGSMMLVARKLVQLQDTGRKLFLFDTFDGMSEPGQEDVSSVDEIHAADHMKAADKMQGNNVWCYSPLDQVRANIKKTGYPEGMLHFIKGKVEDTLPEPSLGPIALLRLDTDWYESTKHELEHLYDKLVVGGILIIDDYGHWGGCRKAVDEFIRERGLKLFLNRIDYTGRLAVKS